MIPYLEWRVIPLGPVVLQVWGLFAAVGVFAGASFAFREAKRRGLDYNRLEPVVVSVVIWAFIGARLGHVIYYAPELYMDDPWEALKFWKGGFSSFGGILGAAAAFFLKTRLRQGSGGQVRQEESLPRLKVADALAVAAPLGLGCGRIGCFLIHDHPGTLAHAGWEWLAVRYPDGPRYDLGLFLGVFDFLLFGLCLLLLKKPRKDGFYPALLTTLYAPVRFGLDYLRADDVRYFGLTPGQYGSALLLLCGLVLFARIYGRGEARRIPAL